MGPVGHSAISAGIGAGVWDITDSPAAGGVALGVGVLTDVDHLFDFYRWYVRRKKGKIYLFFHAWEYSIIGLLMLAFIYYHPVLLAVVLAGLPQLPGFLQPPGLPPLPLGSSRSACALAPTGDC